MREGRFADASAFRRSGLCGLFARYDLCCCCRNSGVNDTQDRRARTLNADGLQTPINELDARREGRGRIVVKNLPPHSASAQVFMTRLHAEVAPVVPRTSDVVPDLLLPQVRRWCVGLTVKIDSADRIYII